VQRFHLQTIFQIAFTQTNLLKTARNDIIIPTVTEHYYGYANKNHYKQFSALNSVKCVFPSQKLIFLVHTMIPYNHDENNFSFFRQTHFHMKPCYIDKKSNIQRKKFKMNFEHRKL